MWLEVRLFLNRHKIGWSQKLLKQNFFGASAGEELVLSTTEPSGLGSLTNPSRGQLKKPLGFLGLLRKSFV
jgi:hypothetical protein